MVHAYAYDTGCVVLVTAFLSVLHFLSVDIGSLFFEESFFKYVS